MSPVAAHLARLVPALAPGLAAFLLLGGPGPLRAQGASCEFLDGTASFNMITLSGGGTISYLGRPRIGCPDGVRIDADSAISYSSQDMTHLLGSVVFRDGTRELRALEARYFPSTGRLQAQGDVRLEDAEDGSVIENGDLVYLRENDFRDRDELTVTTGPDGVRPRATLFIRPQPDTTSAGVGDGPVGPDSTAAVVDSAVAGADSAAVAGAAADSLGVSAPDGAATEPDTVPPTVPDTTPPTPYTVVADRLHLVGEGYFEAIGNTVIDRDSLHATSHRAEYDETAGFLLLQGQALLDGSTYDLEGEEIVLDLPGGEIGDVTARRQALLTGDDIRLEAPVIHLFLIEGLLDRLVAVPMDAEAVDTLAAPDSTLLARPVATAEEFVLTADSVDVRSPGQTLDRIWAVGDARGVSMSRDSLNVEALPEVARHDWLEGDTIIATFRPADPSPAGVGDGAPATPPADSAAPPASDDRGYVLDELVASGSARSLYRLLPSDSTARPGVDPPAVHYVTGSRITIAMLGGEVDRMEVEGPTRGYHLEPLQRQAVSDSLARPDTVPAADTVAVPDTGGVARGGGVASGRVGSGPGMKAHAEPASTPAGRAGKRAFREAPTPGLDARRGATPTPRRRNR